MSYTKTAKVIDGVTDATADQYNSLMAELKAAGQGISTHDLRVVIAYTGGSTYDMPETITITDNSPVEDTGFNITGVGTIVYDENDRPTSFTYVFSAGELNITMTETYTYTGEDITQIDVVMS